MKLSVYVDGRDVATLEDINRFSSHSATPRGPSQTTSSR